MIIQDTQIVGLTKEKVEKEKELGHINANKDRKTKSYLMIIISNVFTYFNMINAALAIWLITVQSYKNMIFVIIVTINTLIGILQEIKYKRALERIMLITEPKINILRDDVISELPVTEIVLGDVIIYEAGKQIVSDGVIISGELIVNESNITGEADSIVKHENDNLYSGSFVISGKAYARTTAVGSDNYAEKLAAEAKKFSKQKSVILKSLQKIIFVIGLIILPLGFFSFINNMNSLTYSEAVVKTVGSMIGMIPAGLFLNTSIALANSVIKLSKKNTLVQELYCIETLARVDVLCLDKTGTLTDGTMSVTEVQEFKENIGEELSKILISDIVTSMNYALQDNNQTSEALRNYFGAKRKLKAKQSLDFNSQNKYSAVNFDKLGTFVLGAPDILLKGTKNAKYVKKANELAKKGQRVLVLANTKSLIVDNKVSGVITPIALISLSDNIRDNAYETLQEFKENNVTIKIISGDNPVTVSEIARKAGVENYDKYISLDGVSDDELLKIVDEYAVFGRVTPNQKRILVDALKKKGHKVAMTGDGVNDILALKSADCSIAMAAGADAAKSVSHLVLLDSNFKSLPSVVGQGRQVINNLQRSGSLFLVKTIFTVVLTMLTIILKRPYTFSSIQLFVIEFFIIGIPSFYLALEPNNQIVRGNFLKNIFKKAVPGAILVILNMIAIFFLESYLTDYDPKLISTICTISATFAYLMVLYSVCYPFNTGRTFIAVASTIAMALCFIGFPNVFDLVPLYAAGSKNLSNVFLLILLMESTYLLMSFSKNVLVKFW